MLYLIRHAKALDRDQWLDDDRVRPLSKAGFRQAEAIARQLARKIRRAAGVGPCVLKSSPAIRCVQTLEPLATSLGLRIIKDESLFEGRSIRLPSSSSTRASGRGVLVLCAHGDNIPWLLDRLGVEWAAAGCRKGSTWVLVRDSAGRIRSSEHLAAP